MTKVAKVGEVSSGKSKLFEHNGEQAILVNVGGELHAFSDVCTHQQCNPEFDGDKELVCPCHGSKYSAVDGSVLNPPAPDPLPKYTVTIDGDDINVE